MKSQSIVRWIIIGSLFGLSGTGCVAQQADLQKIQKDLDQQIRQNRIRGKELAKELEGARVVIAAQKVESQKIISEHKAEMSKMRRNLAPLHQKVQLIAEQDLTRLYGNFEDVEKAIADLKKDFHAHKKIISTTTDNHESDIQSIHVTVQTHGEQLSAAQDQSITLAQQVDESNQAIHQQLTDFQAAFGQFKHALAALDTELRTESQRAFSAEVQLSTEITSQVEHVSTDLATQQQTLQARSDVLSQSILQLQETFKRTGTLLSTRLDEQAMHQTEFRQQVASLKQKLNADTEALRTYLEQDVKAAMTQLGIDMDDRQRPMVQSIEALQSDVEALGLHVQADATQVQNLSQTVVQLREAQASTASLLGKRGDDIIQQAGGLSERMNAIQSDQATLTQQLQSNTKKTLAHLTEVNANLTSNSKRMDQATQSLAQRLTQQEKVVASLNQGIQQLEQFKDKTEGQIQQMQTSSQFADQLRQSVEKVNSRLQDLENHQSGLVSQLDSDVQTVNTSLQGVHNGIHSLKQELENVGTKLSTRIANQEQKLNRAMTRFQRVQDTATVVQTNDKDLKDLRKTMKQLKEALNTIKTKWGGKVDEHEDRLKQLAQRVNLLGSKRKE